MNLKASTKHPALLDTKFINPFIDIEISDLPISCRQFEEIKNSCTYYETVSHPTVNHDNGKILHINIRSILSDKKFEELETFLILSKVEWSVICVSETWLNPQMEARRHINGYTAFFHSRNTTQGGGVAIYIHNKAVQMNLLGIPSPKGTQSLFVECKFQHSEAFIVGVLYRPPNLDSSIFLPELETTLQLVTSKHGTVFIAGDFNYDLLNLKNEPTVQDFFNIFSAYGFLPTISKTTRLSADKMSVIDNIFTNNIGIVSGSGIVFDDMSDHFPIFLNTEISAQKVEREKETTRFDHRQINNLSEHLYNSLEADGFMQIVDPEITCNTLLEAYELGIKKYSIRYTPNRKNTAIKPWISPGILCSINNKQKLFTEKSKNPTNENINKYIKHKNMLNSIIREAKKIHFRKEIQQNKGKPKELWKTLNTLTKGNKPTVKFPSVFRSDDGEDISDRDEVAESFNNFFSTIGIKLREKIPQTNLDPVRNIENIQVHLDNFEPTTQGELISVIKCLKNVGAGVDGINAKIFKGTYRAILDHILHLMNICILKGVFPRKLKIAVIKPIYKAGSKSLFGNYRPISMSPYISKVLEKLIHSRLMKYLTTSGIINENQCGFQNELSTYMPHILLQEKITKAFENGRVVCGIYLDLKKAFDTVDPKVLHLKLQKYGLGHTALQIIKSYLESRTQCVEIDGIRSRYNNIHIGVPQGSILGPLLFLIYINDFPKVCSQSTCLLYADDTALFFEGSSSIELQGKLNKDLPDVCKWLQVNKLSLNTEKTFCQLYNQTKKQFNLNVYLNGKEINFVDKVKYLGMFIDKKLAWQEHIDYVATTLSANIGVLYRSKYFLDQSTRLLLYNSLILPHLNYCAIIWAHTFPTYMQTIVVLQKRAVRIIDNADRLAHTDPIYKKLKLLKVKQLAKQQMILLIHRSLFQNVRPDIKKMFPLVEQRRINTRNIQHIIEPYSPKLYKTKTVAWMGPRLWNSIITTKFSNIESVPRSKFAIKKFTKEHFLDEVE